METIDKLRPSEQRAFMCNTYRAALAFKRTGDIDHLVNFANNLIATVHLRSVPEYVEALENAPPDRSGSGGSLDVDEVIKDLME